ncbi:hypothetical protein E143388_07657 [Rhodococcus opacus]|nr:hypothetical protein E143388_07657 [Rhodococcus opacus]
MPSLTPDEHPRTDLATRTDIEDVLRRFYGRVLVDDLLAVPVAEIRESGLESHLPIMCDFWETVLIGARLYQGSALRVQPERPHSASTRGTPLPTMTHPLVHHGRADVSWSDRCTRHSPSHQDRPGDAPQPDRHRLRRTRCPHLPTIGSAMTTHLIAPPAATPMTERRLIPERKVRPRISRKPTIIHAEQSRHWPQTPRGSPASTRMRPRRRTRKEVHQP